MTAQRNIFGTDTVAVGQQVYHAYAEHRVNERLDVYGRGAHVRNGAVQTYPALVDVATDASGGARYRVTPSIAVAAEAGYAQFRRRGSPTVEHAPSALAGAIWSVPRGWLQLNAHYFPIGYFPTISFPYSDREGVFAAGEWDAHRLVRLFAGGEFATTGLDEAAAEQASAGVAPGTQSRGYGGLRVRVGDRSLVSVRVEDGAREIRPSNFSNGYESDTGVVSADWHAGFERWNAFARYERRENVDPNNQGSSFTQHDASVHTYIGAGPGRQLFAQALFSRRADRAGDGQTLWQVGGGAQMSLARWYLRIEGTAGRTSDWTSAIATNRQSVAVGFSGQIARNTQFSADCYVDRSPLALLPGSPWTTRTMMRVTRSFPFGTARSAALPGSPVRSGPTGRITGVVFADWDGDGQFDSDEEAVGGISVAVPGAGTVTSGTDGRFSFAGVPVGANAVAVDLSTLPADYDPPAEPERAVEIARNRASDVAIGLLPLTSIAGVVYQDADGDGQLSASDVPVNGAVVVLDDGARTEVSRAGRFRFDAIRMGTHAVTAADRIAARRRAAGRPADVDGGAEQKPGGRRDRIPREARETARGEEGLPAEEVKRTRGTGARGPNQGDARRNRSGTDAPCGPTGPRTTKVTRPACSPLPTHRATVSGRPSRSTPSCTPSPLPRKLIVVVVSAAPPPGTTSGLSGSTVSTTSPLLAVRAAALNSIEPASTGPSYPRGRGSMTRSWPETRSDVPGRTVA